MYFPETGLSEILKKGLLQLGISPSDDRLNVFALYLSELKKWNTAYNLTGIRDEKGIIIKHFLDSLLYLKFIPHGFARIADVGSGAGFPGIPLKIVRPELEMFLIEPSAKRAAFLRHITRQIHMDRIEIIEKRVEEINASEELKDTVDVAVTRALFTVKEFVHKASHIVRPGGIFILSKGPRVREELKKARDLEYELFKTPIPRTDITRYIVVVKAKGLVSG